MKISRIPAVAASIIPVSFVVSKPVRLVIRFVALLVLGWVISVADGFAEVITQNFTNDPALSGWQVSGDTTLFSWNSTNQNLSVTWDSTRTNSYFYHSLSNTLQVQDAFTLDFDLDLASVDGGTNAAELAVGFINLASATDPSFQRFTGYQSPNIGEFDYFPPAEFGASIDATTTDQYSDFIFNYDFTQTMDTGVLYHVSLRHNSGDLGVGGTVYTYDTNGALQVFTTLPYSYVEPGFTDFFFDTVAVCSYNSADPGDDGSIYATGTVGNIAVTTQPRSIGNIVASLVNGATQISFNARTGYDFVLQRTIDFSSWTNLSTNTGASAPLTVTDNNGPVTNAFYRVLARPH